MVVVGVSLFCYSVSHMAVLLGTKWQGNIATVLLSFQLLTDFSSHILNLAGSPAVIQDVTQFVFRCLPTCGSSQFLRQQASLSWVWSHCAPLVAALAVSSVFACLSHFLFCIPTAICISALINYLQFPKCLVHVPWTLPCLSVIYNVPSGKLPRFLRAELGIFSLLISFKYLIFWLSVDIMDEGLGSRI